MPKGLERGDLLEKKEDTIKTSELIRKKTKVTHALRYALKPKR